MRLSDESCLTLRLADRAMHVLVGSADRGGVVLCHVLPDEPTAADSYVCRVNLHGQVQFTSMLSGNPAEATTVLEGVRSVDPALWRVGLGVGLRRRGELWKRLADQRTGADPTLLAEAARTAAMAFTVRVDDDLQRQVFAGLAPSWAGTLEELQKAGRAAAR